MTGEDLDALIEDVRERMAEDPEYARGVEEALGTVKTLMQRGCTRAEAIAALEAMREDPPEVGP